jgi:hypothetical protein
MKVCAWLLKGLALSMGLSSWMPTAMQAQSFDRALPCGSAQYYGGPYRMVMDKAGNSYILGFFDGTATFGSTVLTSPVRQAFLAKLDATGNYQWAVQLGAQGPSPSSLAVDGLGDVYVAGYFTSNSIAFGTSGLILYNSSALGEAFVAKLSGTTQQWLWACRAGGTQFDNINTLAATAAGDVYVGGTSFSSTADFGSIIFSPMLQSTAFIAKLSAAGTWAWVRPVGDAQLECSSLLLDAQGAIYIAGDFTGTAHLGAYALATTQSIGSSSAGRDVFLAKTDDAGNWLWVTQGAPNGRNQVYCSALTADGTGHLYLAGNYSHLSAQLGSTYLPNLSNIRVQNPLPPSGVVNYYQDAYVARVDAGTGAWQWAARNGGPYDEYATTIAADARGQVFVAGNFTSTTSQQLAQLNESTGAWGAIQSVERGINLLLLDAQGRLWQGGTFTGNSATFGGFTLLNSGNLTTGYLARSSSGLLAARPADLTAAELRVWPNPTLSRMVQIEGALPNQTVELFDLLGRAVGKGRMPAQGPLQLPLSTSLPAGTYIIRSAARSCALLLE